MNLDLSLQSYVDNPNNYHLQMEGDTLCAVEGKIEGKIHEILFPVLEELKQLGANPLAQKVLTVIRNEQLEDGSSGHNPSVCSRIQRAVATLFRRNSPIDLETNLHEWCEKAIGTEEYESRITAAKQIQKCSLNKETHLVLTRLHLTSLPDSIGNLTALKKLDCSGNWLLTLPDSIGHLTALEKLDCSSNLITTLPDSMRKLTALKKLDCSGSLTSLFVAIQTESELRLLTTLPDFIGDLTSLEKLYCSGNLITTLPESIGHLTALRKLDCSGNKLTTLPESTGNLTSLENLNCSHNSITTLPSTLARLPNSCRSDFRNNDLTPASIQLFREAITAERAINPSHGPNFEL